MPSALNDETYISPPLSTDPVETLTTDPDPVEDQSIPPHGMKIGLQFPTKEKSIEAVLDWCMV